MSNRKKGLVFSLLISLVLACSPKTTAPAGKDNSKTNTTESKEIFAEAKLMYDSKCTTCHAAKDPSKYTQAELQKIVPAMVVKTNKKAGSEVINAAQQQLLMDYLVSICKK